MEDDQRQKIIDEMNEVLRSRKNEVVKNYVSLREPYQNSYNMPELDPLRYEVTLCLILGLHQAAITLTNHLLETFLKMALGYHHSLQKMDKTKTKEGVKSLVEDFREGVDTYADKDLSFTINRACTVGLITKDQKNQLHKIREDFRNAFSHGDKKKVFGDTEIPVQGVNFENDKLHSEPETLQQLLYLPFVHGIAQARFAETNAVPYFQYVDSVIRETLPKVLPSLKSGEDKVG